MGRAPLLTAAVLALEACQAPEPPAEGAGGHEGLACATCHSGGLSDRPLAGAPPEACADGACHADGGPAEVALAAVVFRHRNHGGGAGERPASGSGAAAPAMACAV